MSGLLTRLPRRGARSQARDEHATEPSDEQATTALPAEREAPDGDPGALNARQRAQLRRRAQYLRKLRNLQLRDLGGLIFDLHRFERQRDDLVASKLAGLEHTDGEMRAADAALGSARHIDELREAGIGGSCQTCGALFGSDARFCSTCGTELATGAQTPQAATSAEPVSSPPAAAP